MNVLVTGGAGYIGSHAVKALLAEGHRVVAFDNLFRGHRRPLELLQPLAQGRLHFVHGDITNATQVLDALQFGKIDTIMHFAALAYVGESVDQPLTYIHNNVTGLSTVLASAKIAGVQRFVFSSSCSTYGMVDEKNVPVREDAPKGPVSPYGWTKLYGEYVLKDFAESCRRAGTPFAYTCLRYFNVCGCDRSGLLGEDHTPETHLIPVVLQAALKQRDHVAIFGTDYPTIDGTCVRDYVHVEDLAGAHVLAMNRLKPGDESHYNVGIGKGYSVRQIIQAVERVTKTPIVLREQPRRAGDPPLVYADPAKIRRELGWNAAVTDLDEIIDSAWRWFKAHPKGYNA